MKLIKTIIVADIWARYLNKRMTLSWILNILRQPTMPGMELSVTRLINARKVLIDRKR